MYQLILQVSPLCPPPAARCHSILSPPSQTCATTLLKDSRYRDGKNNLNTLRTKQQNGCKILNCFTMIQFINTISLTLDTMNSNTVKPVLMEHGHHENLSLDETFYNPDDPISPSCILKVPTLNRTFLQRKNVWSLAVHSLGCFIVYWYPIQNK
jgi:hypothetical protein